MNKLIKIIIIPLILFLSFSVIAKDFSDYSTKEKIHALVKLKEKGMDDSMVEEIMKTNGIGYKDIEKEIGIDKAKNLFYSFHNKIDDKTDEIKDEIDDKVSGVDDYYKGYKNTLDEISGLTGVESPQWTKQYEKQYENIRDNIRGIAGKIGNLDSVVKIKGVNFGIKDIIKKGGIDKIKLKDVINFQDIKKQVAKNNFDVFKVGEKDYYYSGKTKSYKPVENTHNKIQQKINNNEAVAQSISAYSKLSTTKYLSDVIGNTSNNSLGLKQLLEQMIYNQAKEIELKALDNQLNAQILQMIALLVEGRAEEMYKKYKRTKQELIHGSGYYEKK